MTYLKIALWAGLVGLFLQLVNPEDSIGPGDWIQATIVWGCTLGLVAAYGATFFQKRQRREEA